jgi:hypothetical protein
MNEWQSEGRAAKGKEQSAAGSEEGLARTQTGKE